jgi:alcohol dehydrogenase class IV
MNKKINGQIHLDKIDLVESLLIELGSQKIFLVADATAYAASGASDILEPIIAGELAFTFDDIEVNPKLAGVLACAEKIRETKPDLLMVVGGGSAMDVAKLANWFASEEKVADRFLAGESSEVGCQLPLVAIPTTAGSGAEATHFAVAYVDGVKKSASHVSLRPTVAVVDPQLTAQLPATITAHSGLDALCQSIESIWSVGANEESLNYATEALDLIWNHLERAVNESTPESRAAMARGSHLAGQAINITKTTLPHALSYSITTQHGVPHGVAVALTLGPALIYNEGVSDADCMDSRGPDSVRERIDSIRHIMGNTSVEECASQFETLLGSIGCSTTLREAGITDENQLKLICQDVNAERLRNNPRRISEQEILNLLR